MTKEKPGAVVSKPGSEKVYRKREQRSKPPQTEAFSTNLNFPFDLEDLFSRAVGTRCLCAYANSEQTASLIFEGKRPLPKLPKGYYLKGSAPRELLRATLFPEQARLVVRDFDIVRFRETSDQKDHQLSLQYMSDDYQFGRGVEVVESKEIYFSSRDLSINEVLYHDRELEFSYQAVRDLKENVFRATTHITDAQGQVDSRITAKALRLMAESLIKNSEPKLEGFPDTLWSSPFDIALHLDRALAIDPAVADEFLQLAWENGLLLVHREVPPGVVDAVIELHGSIKAGADFFRNLTPEQLKELMRRL